MRLTDLLTLPVAALWQQKVRTLLTTLGVVFGAFVLAASLSIGEGVQETIDRESRRNDLSRRIEVFPKAKTPSAKPDADGPVVNGGMNDARRSRIRKSLAGLKRPPNPVQVWSRLTRERLDQMAAVPHVARVVPLVTQSGLARYQTKSEGARIASARPDDEGIRRRIVAGRCFDAPDQRVVIVSELLAYRLGLVEDAAVERLIGKPLRLEFRTQQPETRFAVTLMNRRGGEPSREERSALDKVAARLPKGLEALGLTKPESEVLRKALQEGPATKPDVFTEEFTVAGVIREMSDDERKENWDSTRVDADVLLPYQTARDFYLRGSVNTEQGVPRAVVGVDSEENVRAVAERIAELGVGTRAYLESIEQERLIYLLIFAGMTCVAVVALLVSALGIANTMLMSVLERTREIGIMKALGADNRHLQFIFLVEGALIGLLGGGIGLLLAWAASYPGNAWVRSMVMRDLKVDLKGSIFVFPASMVATVVLFTLVVTTLAAVYPARHAARIEPVSALRHE
jgi:putative ABC transport system permease protein